MKKSLLLYALAGLIVGKVTMAQPCRPAAVEKHLATFWDRFKQLDTFPVSFVANTNRLYRAKEKQLYFMGTVHSADIGWPLYRKIDSVMAGLRPELILVENYYAAEDQDLNTAVTAGADVGYVSHIGRTNKVRIKSWDKMAEVYNQLIPQYGHDSALVMFLNSIGDYGLHSQRGEQEYGEFRYSFQLNGGLLTPAQQSFAYYRQIFQRYYKQPLLLPVDSGYAAQQVAVQHDEARRQGDSRFTQLRDQRLLQVLQRELPGYVRIYLQAGAAHFHSLQEMIPCYLEPARPTVKSIRSKENQGAQGLLLTTRAPRNQTQQIMIGFVNYQDSSAGQQARIEKQIKEFAPDIILTCSPALLYSTRAETMAASGVTGFTRFLAIDKKISLNQWTPYWGDVYYHFISNYSNEELYMTCLALNILQDGAIRTIEAFRTKFYQAAHCMRFSEYPFRDKEFDFNAFIGKLVKGEPAKNAYTLQEMLSFVRKKSNPPLEAAIKQYQVAWFFTTPLSGLQNLPQKKIYIQMEEGYRACLK